MINDVFNRQNSKTFSGFDRPNQLVIAGNYITPKVALSGVAGRLR